MMSMRERTPFIDFKKIKAFIANKYKIPEIPTNNYIKVDDISANGIKVVAIDCETTGLDIHSNNTKPLSWGFSWKREASEVIILK